MVAVRNRYNPNRSGIVVKTNVNQGKALVDFGDKDADGNPKPIWCLTCSLDTIK